MKGLVYKALGLFKGKEETACLFKGSWDVRAVAMKLIGSGQDCEV